MISSEVLTGSVIVVRGHLIRLSLAPEVFFASIVADHTDNPNRRI
jgi:hypothetical protein